MRDWLCCVGPSRREVRAAGRRGAAVRAAGPPGGWGPQARGERREEAPPAEARLVEETVMQLGIVGLGRMGGNMARRLMKGGHQVVGYAADPPSIAQLASEGMTPATTLDEFVARLRQPRVAWVMVPAGAATEQVVTDLAKRMAPDDTIVDGGNAYYKDDVRRMKALAPRHINYVDVGTSGGVWGLERGYCLMIGGGRGAVAGLEAGVQQLAP